MQTLLSAAPPALGILIGAAIGLGFGWIQNLAAKRNQEQEAKGNTKSPWRLMPGSGGRVALLLLVLVLIQILCPMLFNDGVQWWVSGGLMAGYGWMLYQKLRRRMAQA